MYDVAHNIAKIEDHVVDGKQRRLIVHRKGATRAFLRVTPSSVVRTGEPVNRYWCRAPWALPPTFWSVMRTL